MSKKLQKRAMKSLALEAANTDYSTRQKREKKGKKEALREKKESGKKNTSKASEG